MKRFFLTLVVFLIALVCVCQPSSVTKVAINSYKINAITKNPRGFILYIPKDYDPSGATKYPVLYWLHGIGSGGSGSLSDLDKIFNKTISKWLKTNDVPFIVFIPQDTNGYFGGGRFEKFADWCKAEFAAVMDLNQQHVAGLSGGGYGIREFIVDNSDTYKDFATLTPMSTSFASIKNIEFAQRIIDNDQFLWFHHGTTDGGSNKITTITQFHKNVQSLDPERSRLTAYVGMGHSAWNEVYDNSGKNKNQWTGTDANGVTYYEWLTGDQSWYEWMLSKAKSSPPSFLNVSKLEVENGTLAGSIVGELSSNGSVPKAYSFVTGVGDDDNARFSISGSNLIIEEKTDFSKRATYSVRLQVSNDKGSVDAPYTITVVEENTAPTIAEVTNQETEELGEISFIVTASDANEDLITYSLDNSSKSKGMSIDAVSGEFKWRPSEVHDGLHSVTVKAFDGELTGSETFEITVAEVNLPPALDEILNQEIDEGEELVFSVSAKDNDFSIQDLIYSIDSKSIQKGMSINSSDGSFSWHPTEDQDGSHSVTFRVSDGIDSDAITISITVKEVNARPKIEEIKDIVVFEEANIEFIVEGVDADLNDQLTFSLDSVSVSKGVSIDQKTGIITWSPGKDQYGDHTITVTVSDGQISSEKSFIITVLNKTEIVNKDKFITSVNSKTQNLSFFPNPAKQDMRINMTNDFYGDIQLRFYDLSGRLALEKIVAKKSKRLESIIGLEKLAAGVYSVRTYWSETSTAFRLVKQ